MADIFDKIMSGEVPSRMIYKYQPDPEQPAELAVVVDLNPATQGHVFTVARECVPRWQDLPEVTVAKMAVLGQFVARQLTHRLPADLIYRLTAGNQIAHPHEHFIPAYHDMGEHGDPVRRMHPDSSRMAEVHPDKKLDQMRDVLMFPEEMARYIDERLAAVTADYENASNQFPPLLQRPY